MDSIVSTHQEQYSSLIKVGSSMYPSGIQVYQHPVQPMVIQHPPQSGAGAEAGAVTPIIIAQPQPQNKPNWFLRICVGWFSLCVFVWIVGALVDINEEKRRRRKCH